LVYFIRFEGNLPYEEWVNFRTTIVYILILKLSIFAFFDLYRGMWRYTSLVDLLNIFKATAVSSGLIILSILFIYRFEGFPRSVFVIDWLLSFLFISGNRVGIRLLFSERQGAEIGDRGTEGGTKR
jgi:FlaA1/EpsC-like NDP-sugar epimerase